jgi:hypothetical protein
VFINFFSNPGKDPNGELFSKIKQHSHVYIEWKSKLQVSSPVFIGELSQRKKRTKFGIIKETSQPEKNRKAYLDRYRPMNC